MNTAEKAHTATASIRLEIGPIYDEHVNKIEARLKIEPRYDTAVITVHGSAMQLDVSREVLERALHEVVGLREAYESQLKSTSRKRKK